MLIPAGIVDGNKELQIESFNHTIIAGSSGTGKSTFIERIIIFLLRAGQSVIYLDPHGTSIRTILKYIPRWLSIYIVYFNPLSKRVPGINFFAFSKDRDKVVNAIVSILKSLFADSWGAETQHVTTVAGNAVAQGEENPTIIHMFLFVARGLYRQMVIARSDDQVLRDFYHQFDEELRASERMGKLSPALNKLFQFIQPVIRTVFGQVETLDIIGLVDTGHSIFIDLDKGKIGDIAASLIGSAIMAYIQLKALERKSRRDCTIFVDEFQNFCHGVRWDTFFAEIRKYGFRIWLAFQSFSQIPESWRDIVLDNCANILCFAVGWSTAARMSREFGEGDQKEKELIYLSDFTFSAKIKHDHDRGYFSKVEAYNIPPKNGEEWNWRDVIKTSRMRWGKDRKWIDQGILTLLNRQFGGEKETKRRKRSL